MDVSRRPPGELTVVGFALLVLGGLAVTEGARSGRDALTIVGAFAFAAILVGIVMPILAMRGVRVRVVSPPDATVGDDVELAVEVRGRSGEIALRVLDPSSSWHRCEVPGSGRITHRAEQRGVFQYLAIELRTSAPLGVFVRRRVEVVELANAVHVAPRPRRMGSVVAHGVGGETSAPAGVAYEPGDHVRAVRPHVMGDALRFVHWPSTARRGELVVRELEPPGGRRVALVVDCSDPPFGETVASVAAAAGRELLSAGIGVMLCRTTRAGAQVGSIATVRELDRALAEIVAGVPPSPPAGLAAIDVAALARGEATAVGAGARA